MRFSARAFINVGMGLGIRLVPCLINPNLLNEWKKDLQMLCGSAVSRIARA
jgi:hypothetical protein